MHIASGSSYSYLTLFAYEKNLLIEENYLNIDPFNRKIHNCNFFRGLYRLARYGITGKSFFDNNLIDATSAYIFKPEFYNLTLSELPNNLHFWTYCNYRESAIELSARNGFGYLTVAQLFRACISIRFFHGGYYHKDYCFSDINFSQGMRVFKRRAKRSECNNLVINFSANKEVYMTTYIKHSRSAWPKAELLKDFLFFLFNIPNTSVKKTHLESISRLRDNALEES